MTRMCPHIVPGVSPLAATIGYTAEDGACQQCLNIYTIMQDHAIQYRVPTSSYQLNLRVVEREKPAATQNSRLTQSEWVYKKHSRTVGRRENLTAILVSAQHWQDTSFNKEIYFFNMWRCLRCRDVVWLLLKQGLMILRYSFCLLLEEGRVVLVNLAPRTI